jgi:hypothetical protein
MMTPHFSLEEFTQSDTADRLGIDNTLPEILHDNARKTLEMMERIRFHIDAPITITSGYRSKALNQAIGSKPTSDHTLAFAVDFKAPKAGKPYDIAKDLAGVIDVIGIGQLILEFGSWVHVSLARPDKAINRIITIDKTGVRAGIWIP